MSEITTIGLDLAKSVFQVHGADAAGKPVLRRKLRRSQYYGFFADLPRCLVALEACSGAHHIARELQELGHDVRLIPPQYVKPFVKTNKNDAADAEAICEAAQRPTMRFVAVKSRDQQSVLMIHRARELLVRQRTMVINALRGHLAEFGVHAAQGRCNAGKLVENIIDNPDNILPELAQTTLQHLVAQLDQTNFKIKELEQQLKDWHKENADCQRLTDIPGVGLITATAVVATVGNASQFTSARQFSAWLGIVPKQFSSGGKEKLGRISKHGDSYIRRLLVHGARASLRWSRDDKTRRSEWQKNLLARRPTNVVLVAMANKNARIIWAMLTRRQAYQAEWLQRA
jgi:transposase